MKQSFPGGFPLTQRIGLHGGFFLRQRINLPGGIDMTQQGTHAQLILEMKGRCARFAPIKDRVNEQGEEKSERSVLVDGQTSYVAKGKPAITRSPLDSAHLDYLANLHSIDSATDMHRSKYLPLSSLHSPLGSGPTV